MKEILTITQIADKNKARKKEDIHVRYVEMSDEMGTLKLIFNNAFGDLPSQIRSLDREMDLHTEVEVEISLHLKSRQTRLA